MLYINEVRELPSGDDVKLFSVPSGKQGECFVYLRTGPSWTDENGKRHNSRESIGKTVTVMTETGEKKTVFHPNENYFRHFREPLPSGAVLRGSGRPPVTPEKPAEYEKAEEGSVLSMGYGIAFHKEASDTGITSALTEAPGPDRAMQALAVASFYARDRERGLTLLSKFTEHSLCFTGAPVDARRACELFASVTPAERAVFSDSWMASAEELAKGQAGKDAERRFVFYDVTSVSSYSELIKQVARGYNRDGEALKQVNTGLFMDGTTGLPLYCTWYDGSVNDASSFRNVLKEAQERGLDKNVTVVGDGIFSDSKCVAFMAERGYTMIVGISAERIAGVYGEISAWRREINAAGCGDSFLNDDECDLSSREVPFAIGEVRGRLIMYHDTVREGEEKTAASRKYRKTLAELKACGFTLTEPPCRYVRRLFDVVRNREAGTWTVSENREKLADAMAQCGSFALFTTLSPEKDTELIKWHASVLERCREKDACEKAFAALKNDMIGERMFSHSSKGWQGKLPVVFASLAVRKSLYLKLRTWIRQKRVNLEYAFEVLDELRCRKRGDHWVVENTLTKEQKEVCGALGLDMSIMEKTLHGS